MNILKNIVEFLLRNEITVTLIMTGLLIFVVIFFEWVRTRDEWHT